MSSVSDIDNDNYNDNDNDNEYQIRRIGKSWFDGLMRSDNLWLTKHSIITVCHEYIKVSNSLSKQIPDDTINIDFDLTSQNSTALFGFITCSKIESIVIGKHKLWLKDNDKNQLFFTLDPFVEHYLKLNTNSWIRLVKAIENTLFPVLVNNILADIYSKGSYKIDNIIIYINGVNFSNKFVGIENVSCSINFKNWEVKMSNRKNIFHRKILSTSNPNVVILPYLIESLRILTTS